jgi:hypothetical protein
MFAHPLKQHSIEVKDGIKENIAFSMPPNIGYLVLIRKRTQEKIQGDVTNEISKKRADKHFR